LLTTSEVVRFENVTKRYRYRDVNTLKEFLPKFLRHEQGPTAFDALHEVSFSVSQGETVALVGANGSGKSTALKIVAGVTRPSSGTATVIGRVAPLLQLGAGFHPDLTGRENIFLNACILGLTDVQIRATIDPIVEFAEISDFLDSPVKHYSSGMFLRLAFAVAVHAEPDILIVDEALSVGDMAFQAKCVARIKAMQKNGVTILFVSHSPVLVQDFCDRAILLSHGYLITQGDPKEVMDRYRDSLSMTLEDVKAAATVG